ncbi:hypothetical protein [Luteirhabdus pelagi]|uniref:hypothetical protein n=1 Tax=Luteirhabdus pelagi TaxID=2792783 RepID=UPI001939DDBD|nr:hypothetical protein [Luteirhabdus pelagi]
MEFKGPYIRLSVVGCLSVAAVILLFLLSENQIHRNNAFTRRYPHHPTTKLFDIPLGFDSYYLAGYDEPFVYLGNTTAPKHIVRVNLRSKDTTHIRVQMENEELPYKFIQIKVVKPYFFVMDGTVPIILKGSLRNWKADTWMKDEAFFSSALPIDTQTIYVRTISSKTNESVLGVVEKNENFLVDMNPNVLERQVDGVFDVDGIMVSDNANQKLGYVYYYRNEFMIMDRDLKLMKRLHTVDTIHKARLELSEINSHGEIQMNKPPLMVNKWAALSRNLLFIQSDRLGKYEPKEMLEKASIVDVYDWENETYEFSFYLYGILDEKPREFNVYGDLLISLIGSHLAVYRLKPEHFED